MTSQTTSLLALKSLKQFREIVSRDAQTCEHRIVVRNQLGEGLYLSAQAGSTIYVVWMAGIECPEEVVWVLVSEKNGKAKGYEWSRVQGGPSVEQIARYITNDVPVWDSI